MVNSQMKFICTHCTGNLHLPSHKQGGHYKRVYWWSLKFILDLGKTKLKVTLKNVFSIRAKYWTQYFSGLRQSDPESDWINCCKMLFPESTFLDEIFSEMSPLRQVTVRQDALYRWAGNISHLRKKSGSNAKYGSTKKRTTLAWKPALIPRELNPPTWTTRHQHHYVIDYLVGEDVVGD